MRLKFFLKYFLVLGFTKGAEIQNMSENLAIIRIKTKSNTSIKKEIMVLLEEITGLFYHVRSTIFHANISFKNCIKLVGNINNSTLK
jgi:hypothetical protein